MGTIRYRFMRLFGCVPGWAVRRGGRVRPPVGYVICLGLNVAGRQALFLQILLVVILSFEEGLCGNNLGDDRLAEAVGFFQLFFGSLGRSLLFRAVEKNRRTILLTPIWPLAVELSGIVVLPKDFEQLVVGEL